MKKLIITADDVGLHPGMTRGALAAADQGIVTAVSVASVGHAFEEAIDLLRDRPTLDVGVHLTLVGEKPLSPPGQIPSLVGRDGALLPGYAALARRAALGGLAAADIETELHRQIERLLATGLPVVHANAHQHLHVLPPVFEIVLRLAEEHGIRYVRIPNEPALAGRWSPRAAQLVVLNHLGRKARRRLKPGGPVQAVERTVGIFDAGHLSVERLARALPFAADTSELVCHPGLGNAELAAAYDWDYDWDTETAALCDPRVPEMLREAGVERASFAGLPKLPPLGVNGTGPGPTQSGGFQPLIW